MTMINNILTNMLDLLYRHYRDFELNAANRMMNLFEKEKNFLTYNTRDFSR